jgi:hypothetical protein
MMFVVPGMLQFHCRRRTFIYLAKRCCLSSATTSRYLVDAKDQGQENMQSQNQKSPDWNPRKPPTFADSFTNFSLSLVPLHVSSRQQAKKASTKCRDAWLCKVYTSRTHNLDSHASKRPVDVFEHIHLNKRDPLRLQARNLLLLFWSRRSQVFPMILVFRRIQYNAILLRCFGW